MQSQRSLIQLDGFEGPFDLLLELIREHKLDVSALSLREITDDFLTYMRTHRMKPEFLGDFLVVAATLLLVKTRETLGALAPEEEEEIEQLTARLSVYQEFRKQAAWIIRQWNQTPLLSGSAFGPSLRQVGGQQAALHMPSLNLSELHKVMQYVAGKLPKPIAVRAHMRPRGKSLQECLDLFWSRLQKLRKVIFQDVVAEHSKQDIAVSFLAVLELARRGRVELSQQAAGENIVITTS